MHRTCILEQEQIIDKDQSGILSSLSIPCPLIQVIEFVNLYVVNTGEKVFADITVVDTDNILVKTAKPISAEDKIKVVIIGHNGG